ncbi:acyl-CoA carboxylase epsilon subunit [Agromyces arachidis]|uniref:acyl-CoA carboxylase epsilon subunit n=1 Tax=Agromyces arachidis TaxID=766966 RepID=UPI004057BFBA
MSIAAAGPNGDESVDLRFVTADVSPEEAAAVTAVIVAAVHEEQAAPPPPARSAWSHPRNALRPPIEVGAGRWSAALR